MSGMVLTPRTSPGASRTEGWCFVEHSTAQQRVDVVIVATVWLFV